LAERQADLGFDFALVLDADGGVIARTDGKPLRGETLRDDAIVAPVIASLSANTGYWSNAAGVFQVAVVPLADGFELAGFLVAGLAFDNALAAELHAASGAHYLVAQRSGDTWRALAATRSDVDALLANRDVASLAA